MTDEGQAWPQIRQDIPHSARIWNYWLGGKDSYPIDRQVGDEIVKVNPAILEIARAQRGFLIRVVRYLVAECGIRQFIDIGTGLPTADNTHQVAQRIAPDTRIVYVDNDPLVLVHARALLASTPEGACAYIDADVHDPDHILGEAAGTLDFSKPIAITMLGITGHLTDDAEASAIVRRLMGGVPSGSYLALCDDTAYLNPEAMDEMVRQWNQAGESPRINRSPDQIAAFFEGLDLVEPGVVSCPRWRPDLAEAIDIGGQLPEVDDFGGVARKP